MPSAYPITLRWSWECVLYLIINIKSEVWIINHYLGLGHETKVCFVCLTMFLYETDWNGKSRKLSPKENHQRNKLQMHTTISLSTEPGHWMEKHIRRQHSKHKLHALTLKNTSEAEIISFMVGTSDVRNHIPHQNQSKQRRLSADLADCPKWKR